MKKLLLLFPFLLSQAAQAEKFNLLVEISTDLCRAEAEAQAGCASRVGEQGVSCLREVQEHEKCYKRLPALVAPLVAPVGLALDPEYAVDYTAVRPRHYILRGTTCAGSKADLKTIEDTLKAAGFGVSLWTSGSRPGNCP